MRESKALYDASAQDLRFGIGLLADKGGRQLPMICIHYPDWPCKVLEVIRESMRSGITLSRIQRDGESFDLILATKGRSEVHARDDHQTDIIRFPSWDTRLEGIEPGVLEVFDRRFEAVGRFLLIVQTDRWMFEADVIEGG